MRPKEFQDATMEMKKINSGRLRAIGYDARARMLQVQLDNGSRCNTAVLARESGNISAAWRRREVSIATTLRKYSPRSAFPAAPPQPRTRSMSYSAKPEHRFHNLPISR